MLRTAAAATPSPLCSATYSMLFGSLAATGIGIASASVKPSPEPSGRQLESEAALLRVGGIGLAIARQQGFGKTVLLLHQNRRFTTSSH